MAERQNLNTSGIGLGGNEIGLENTYTRQGIAKKSKYVSMQIKNMLKI
jgi:hypothetical protein